MPSAKSTPTGATLDTPQGLAVRDALKIGVARLTEAGVPDPGVDAAWLLEHVTDFPHMLLPVNREALTAGQSAQYDKLLTERARRTPLQYILGGVHFAGASINVHPGVLIPRPETELLTRAAGAFIQSLMSQQGASVKRQAPHPFKRPGRPRLLDLCAGSGAIGIALAKRFPRLDLWAADISKAACDTITVNARLNNVKAAVVQGDMLEPFAPSPLYDGFFDIIVCNPPYIKTSELETLQPEVKREPVLALDGGEDGLDFYREAAFCAPRLLPSHGALFLEIGAGQEESVREILSPCFAAVAIERDFSDIPRVVIASDSRAA